MNFLPALQKPRRNFKFSNPLSGLVYNNNSFLKECHYDLQKQLMQPNERRKPASDRHQRHNQTAKTTGMRKNSYVSRPCETRCEEHSKTNPEFTKTAQTRYLFPKKAKQEKEEKYGFEDIQIKILDVINSIQDCQTKVLKINLSHYFGIYFKKALLGYLTVDFIKIVEKYIQILLHKNELDSPIETRDHPPDIFKINNKRTFVSRIQELEEDKLYGSAQAMVKYYCVPNAEFRESCFRDILHMLSRSLFQNFNMNKDKTYSLLNAQGQVLTDLCEIKFSTKVLMITESHQTEKSYAKYRNIVQENDMSFQRLSFTQGLKKTFRTRIAGGKIDETQAPENHLSQANMSQKKIRTAQILLNRKSQKSIKNFSPSKTAGNFSPSKTAANFSTRRQISNDKRKGAKTDLAMERKNLKKRQVVSLSCRKRNEEYSKSFHQLINNNSKYDITFNHLNENRLLMQVLAIYSDLFKNKSQEQSWAILEALDIPKGSESIGWEEYRKINEVSNCKGDKKDITSFINKYMPFNEFGELDKASLSQILGFILTGDDNADVVEEVIWSWLDKNQLIDNGVVMKTNLESWYEKNKLAYVMLVSLIFGTNKISTIDMAYEVLI